MRSGFTLLAGLVTAVAAAPAVSASVVEIIDVTAASTEGIGSFGGSLVYNPSGPGTGTLQVSLTNTSTAENGGFITGFVFTIDSTDPMRHAELTSASFVDFLDASGQMASPFGGPHDGGAALGGDWMGGGSPHGGIGVGQTGVFTFAIHASDAAMLTAASFIRDEAPWHFVVRFRGFSDGGSDKVPGMIVPAPGVGMLMGAGMLMMGRRRRADL